MTLTRLSRKTALLCCLLSLSGNILADSFQSFERSLLNGQCARATSVLHNDKANSASQRKQFANRLLSNGQRPLHIAIREHNTALLRHLLRYQPDIHAKNRANISALQLAQARGDNRILANLLAYSTQLAPQRQAIAALIKDLPREASKFEKWITPQLADPKQREILANTIGRYFAPYQRNSAYDSAYRGQIDRSEAAVGLWDNHLWFEDSSKRWDKINKPRYTQWQRSLRHLYYSLETAAMLLNNFQPSSEPYKWHDDRTLFENPNKDAGPEEAAHMANLAHYLHQQLSKDGGTGSKNLNKYTESIYELQARDPHQFYSRVFLNEGYCGDPAMLWLGAMTIYHGISTRLPNTHLIAAIRAGSKPAIFTLLSSRYRYNDNQHLLTGEERQAAKAKWFNEMKALGYKLKPLPISN